MDDGEIRLQEFIGAEEKRVELCNRCSGPPKLVPIAPVPTTSGAGNATLCLSATLLCSYSNAYHKSCATVHGRHKVPSTRTSSLN